MKKILIILIAFLIGFLLGSYLFDTKERNGVDTDNWITYTNEEFGFSLNYPPEWEVLEATDAPIAPIVNFYSPESDTQGLPFIHHSQEAIHVSVFPQGVPTEGIFGEFVESEIEFQVSVLNARDFILSSGEVWATFANVEDSPNSWTESGFIFSGLVINNHKVDCFWGGELISPEQCDPPSGDQIVHHGSINEEDRLIQERMLESFDFLE